MSESIIEKERRLEYELSITNDELRQVQAECERLKAELTNYKLGFATANEDRERLKAELSAWHSQFGSQLSHAVEERERLKAELAESKKTVQFVLQETNVERHRLQAELERYKAESGALRSEVAMISGELIATKTKLKRSRDPNGEEYRSTLERIISELRVECERLKAELAQERDKVRQCMEHMHCYRCGMPDLNRHGTPHFQVAAYDLHDGRGELAHIMRAYCADCERAMADPKEKP